MGQFYRRNIDSAVLFVGTRNPSESLVTRVAPFGLDDKIIAFLDYGLSASNAIQDARHRGRRTHRAFPAAEKAEDKLRRY